MVMRGKYKSRNMDHRLPPGLGTLARPRITSWFAPGALQCYGRISVRSKGPPSPVKLKGAHTPAYTPATGEQALGRTEMTITTSRRTMQRASLVAYEGINASLDIVVTARPQ